MRLGFVSAIFGDLSLEEVLQRAAQIGYDCIEAMCWPAGGPDRKYGGVMHIDCTEFTQAQADDVRALCEKHGVSLSGLGYYSIPLSAEQDQADASRAHLRKVIDAAPKLGLANVNAFVGANRTLPLEANMELFAQVWPDIVRFAGDRGVKIGIENCPMLYGPGTWPFGLNLARSPAIWRRMFETIPAENFGLNYDPSHMVMQMMDPIAPIFEFGSRIFHTHAKDMRLDRRRLDDVGTLVPPMERCTAKIPGLGDVNWGAWIAALTDVEDEAFAGSVERRHKSLEISYNVLRPLIV